MPKLIARRLAANWKLLLAIFAGVIMASSLVVGAPVYLWSLNRLSLNAAIDRAGERFLNLRTFAPFVPLDEAALDRTDLTVNEVLGSSLGEINAGVVRHLRTDSFLMGLPGRPLPQDRASESETPRMFFQTLSDFKSHITVLEGHVAGDAVEQRSEGLLIEGVVGSGIARYFGVRPGDEIVLAWAVSQTARMIVRITGVVAPIDPVDATGLRLRSELLNLEVGPGE